MSRAAAPHSVAEQGVSAALLVLRERGAAYARRARCAAIEASNRRTYVGAEAKNHAAFCATRRCRCARASEGALYRCRTNGVTARMPRGEQRGAIEEAD